MRNVLFASAFLGIFAAAGCSASTAAEAPAASSDDDLTASSKWLPLMDECVQYAVSAAAQTAFQDNNLQHLEGLTVTGDLAEDSSLKISVTTGNDEDGQTSRTVDVTQAVDNNTGTTTCTVTKVGSKSGEVKFDKNALSAIVDPCTGAAIVAAQKISDNYWHLYGLSLDDGDPAQSGDLKYTVTGGNDEDGSTDYKITVSQTISGTTGKSTCKVTSSTSSH